MMLDIKFAKPGMILSSNVIRENSIIPIINSGAELNEKIIESLKRLNVKQIDVQLTQLQQLALKIDKDFENTLPNSFVEKAKDSIKNFDTLQIISNAKEMTKTIIESKEFKYNLSEYKQISDVFSHSVRVATFSVLLAKYYNNTLDNLLKDSNFLEKAKINLEYIATAAMMHDIGKICKDEHISPENIQDFKNYLSKYFPSINDLDMSTYNDDYSSICSCLLLYKNSQLKPDIKMMILLSNEDEIGSGPLKLNEQYTKCRQSFSFASKIIRLCNMYDNELKQTINDNNTLENISAKLDYFAVNGIINEELEKIFVEHIPLYSKGVKVKLSNGSFAVVEECFYGRTDIYKPIVRTIPNFELIDLRSELSLTIQEVCSDEISFFEIVSRQISTMQQGILEEEKNKRIV